ncbi:hypothetical protein MMC27_007357 [Xylographa pallens]|nr:hypothetical protein [Xylographa pallens]
MPSSQKGSKSRTHQLTSSNNNDKIHPVLKYNWTSLDAYLWKDNMIRKLTYTEAHINELARHILRQSPDRWWKVFSSLSNEEHTGLEEAMDAGLPDEARFLLGIHVLRARYAHFLHSILRLVSLGIFDRREMETRALLIIIGNKAADDLADIEGGEISRPIYRRAERERDRAPKVLDFSRPVHIKVHKKYLDTETLDFYGLPWEWYASNNDFIIIKQFVPEHDQDVIFEHTRKRREKQEPTIREKLGKLRDQLLMARKKEPTVGYTVQSVRVPEHSVRVPDEGADLHELETSPNEEKFVEARRHGKASAKSAWQGSCQPQASTTGDDLYSSDTSPPLTFALAPQSASATRLQDFQAQAKRAEANQITIEDDRRPWDYERQRHQERPPGPEIYFTNDDENYGAGMRNQERVQTREGRNVAQSSNARRAPRQYSRMAAAEIRQDDDVVSISDASLYTSPPSENEDIDAAENRVQALLSRWTAPANNEDMWGASEPYAGDMDGPTVEEGEYVE